MRERERAPRAEKTCLAQKMRKQNPFRLIEFLKSTSGPGNQCHSSLPDTGPETGVMYDWGMYSDQYAYSYVC